MKKSKKNIWILPALLMFVANSALASVAIDFKNTERYIDIRIDDMDNPKRFGEEMTPFLNEALDNHLPEGMSLQITFTQIDLAGAFEPWRGPDFNHLRILKDIYAPRLEFTYALMDNEGNIVKEGDTRLIDINYLENVNPLKADRDILYYEKRMMERWMRNSLVKLNP